MQSKEQIIKPKQPFVFNHSLARLKDFKSDGLTRYVDAQELSFALELKGQKVIVELKDQGQDLLSTLHSETLTADLIEHSLDAVSFHLSLQDDLSAFYQLAQKDDAFKPMLNELYGYHQVKFVTVFACACWALVTQRTPNSFAFESMKKLVQFLGDELNYQAKSYTTFPTPQSFLQSNARAALLEATNNTRKTERLLAIAEAFVTADEQFLRNAPYEEVARWLKKIHGLGQWSVDYIMHRGLGRMERSPWTDTQIMRVISESYTNSLSISTGDAKILAETYGWQQGYWVHYLKVLKD